MSEGTIFRAFELARSGTCYSIEDVVKCLHKEGFTAILSHLDGREIKRQLNALIKVHVPAEMWRRR